MIEKTIRIKCYNPQCRIGGCYSPQCEVCGCNQVIGTMTLHFDSCYKHNPSTCVVCEAEQEAYPNGGKRG